MLDVFRIIIGSAVLIFGIFLGNWLAKITKSELKKGQKWFRLIIILSFSSAIVSLIFKNDAFLFTFLFIAIVTSRSLIVKKKK